MGNVLAFLPKRKNQLSPEFLRDLPPMLESIEREWRRQVRTTGSWQQLDALKAWLRRAHEAIAVLQNMHEDGVITS